MQGVKRGKATESHEPVKRLKQRASVLSSSKRFRPHPGASEYPACTENECFETTDAEESDPVMGPILSTGAYVAVSASNRRDASRSSLNTWLENRMRLVICRAKEAARDMRNEWALYFEQIADIGSPLTKLHVTNSLLAMAKRDEVGSRSEAAQRAAARQATACIDVLVGIANSGEREPLELILGFLHTLAVYRGPLNRNDAKKYRSFLELMSPDERTGLKDALGKAKGNNKTAKKARELIDKVGKFEEILVQRASTQSGIAGAEKRNSSAHVGGRIPRKSSAHLSGFAGPFPPEQGPGGSGNTGTRYHDQARQQTTRISEQQPRTAGAREGYGLPPNLPSQPLKARTIEHQPGFSGTSAGQKTSGVNPTQASGAPARVSISQYYPVPGPQVQRQVVPTLPSTQQQHAGIVLAGGGSGQNWDLYGQGAAARSRGDGPQALQQRFPNHGIVEARTYNGGYEATVSDGILKPMRGPASYPSPGVKFKSTESFPPRTYLHEASTVFEIQPQRGVRHLFYDDGDPLDWKKMANKGHIEEIKERLCSGHVHSAMGLHAMVRSKIEDLLTQRDNVGQSMPWRKSIRVAFPGRNARASQERWSGL